MYTLNKSNLNIGIINAKDKHSGKLYIGEKVTAANNGWVLIEVTRPEIKEAEFPKIPGVEPMQNEASVVYSKEAIKISKKIPKSLNPALNQAIVSQDNHLKIASTDLASVNCDTIEDTKETYPDYKQVIPSESSRLHRIALNPAYLEQVCKLAKEFQKEEGSDDLDPTMFIDFHGEGTAIVLQTRNVNTKQDFKAAIMPINYKGKQYEADRGNKQDN